MVVAPLAASSKWCSRDWDTVEAVVAAATSSCNSRMSRCMVATALSAAALEA